MTYGTAIAIAAFIVAINAPIERKDLPLVGCDELRQWLETQGFKYAEDYLTHHYNGCNWYAYRPIAIPARDCECNSGKSMQIVVCPFERIYQGKKSESVEVDITGETGGVWYKIEAYGIDFNELRDKFYNVGSNMIAAWNALRPDATNSPFDRMIPQTESYKDAARYRWLKSRKGLTLRTCFNSWTRADGSKYTSSHYLAEGDTQHAAAESLDATIDAAMLLRPVRE